MGQGWRTLRKIVHLPNFFVFLSLLTLFRYWARLVAFPGVVHCCVISHEGRNMIFKEV